MVFTTRTSPIWERHIEELKHLLQERKNEFTQECIERDLEFAKKHYQTTGNITYSILVNDLPKDFNNLEVSFEVNLYNLIHYAHSDYELRFLYKTSQISFISNLADVLNISEDIALQIHSLLSDEDYIIKSLHESWFRLNEANERNRLFKSRYGSYDPFYKTVRNSNLAKIEKLKSKSSFIRNWRNNRFWKKKGLSRESISKLYSLVSFFYLENDWDRIAYQKLFCFQIRRTKLKDMTDISSSMTDKKELVYLIEFYGSDHDNSNLLVKAERLKKILADGSLLGQKEEIELKETSTGLEVKDTDIERLERTYQGKGLFINAVPLYL